MTAPLQKEPMELQQELQPKAPFCKGGAEHQRGGGFSNGEILSAEALGVGFSNGEILSHAIQDTHRMTAPLRKEPMELQQELQSEAPFCKGGAEHQRGGGFCNLVSLILFGTGSLEGEFKSQGIDVRPYEGEKTWLALRAIENTKHETENTEDSLIENTKHETENTEDLLKAHNQIQSELPAVSDAPLIRVRRSLGEGGKGDIGGLAWEGGLVIEGKEEGKGKQRNSFDWTPPMAGENWKFNECEDWLSNQNSLLSTHVRQYVLGVYLSSIDGFGMAPLECQLAGNPAIILDRGGSRETIVSDDDDQPVGYLVESEDEVLRALSYFLEHKKLPENHHIVNFCHHKDYFYPPRLSKDLSIFMQKIVH